LLVLGRRRERGHAHMAVVEAGNESLDRSALAGCVPALEQDQDGRAEAAVADQAGELEPQRLEPLLRLLEPLVLLLAAELLREVDLIQAPHAADALTPETPTSARRMRDRGRASRLATTRSPPRGYSGAI